MKRSKKTVLISFAVVVGALIVAGLILGAMMITRHRAVSALCDSIKAGENINTHIGNGVSAPVWLDDFFVAPRSSRTLIISAHAFGSRDAEWYFTVSIIGVSPFMPTGSTSSK